MEKIKVLVVDDQLLFAESLKNVLTNRGEKIQVIGIAQDGKEAIQIVNNEIPDVVLMDIRMPGMDGVDSTRQIIKNNPKVKILVLTTFDDDKYVIEALRYGASGYLLKDLPLDELIVAIRAVHKGGVMISPQIAKKLLNFIPLSSKTKQKDIERVYDDSDTMIVDKLSKREKEVLKLLAQGYENKKIADNLYIAEQTVKNHVSRIYSKLQVNDRVQATLIAIKEDLLDNISN